MDTSIVQPIYKIVYIYVLIDLFTGLIRYAGKSTNPLLRFKRHIKDARDGKRDHKSSWIASILNRSSKPVLRVIETCGHDWKERETYWIAKLRADGFDLTNSKSGGDGLEPYEDSRKKMSDAKKGKPPHNKGKPMSSEQRRRLSVIHKKRFSEMTEDQRNRLGEKHKGRQGKGNLTPEQVKYIRIRYAQGDIAYKEIGKQFGLSLSMIHLIVKRKQYQDVE